MSNISVVLPWQVKNAQLVDCEVEVVSGSLLIGEARVDLIGGNFEAGVIGAPKFGDVVRVTYNLKRQGQEFRVTSTLMWDGREWTPAN